MFPTEKEATRRDDVWVSNEKRPYFSICAWNRLARCVTCVFGSVKPDNAYVSKFFSHLYNFHHPHPNSKHTKMPYTICHNVMVKVFDTIRSAQIHFANVCTLTHIIIREWIWLKVFRWRKFMIISRAPIAWRFNETVFGGLLFEVDLGVGTNCWAKLWCGILDSRGVRICWNLGFI